MINLNEIKTGDLLIHTSKNTKCIWLITGDLHLKDKFTFSFSGISLYWHRLESGKFVSKSMDMTRHNISVDRCVINLLSHQKRH
jgi:hypothetical protein